MNNPKMKTYKFTVIRKRFLQFCRRYNANPEDVLGYCEGSLSNFPRWYIDFITYTRVEIRNRVKTGVVNPIRLEDVWS